MQRERPSVAANNTSKTPQPKLSKDKEKRQRQLAQLKYQRQQARRAESLRRTRRLTLQIGSAVVAVALLAGGTWALTSGGSKKKSASADAAASATPSAAASASSTAAPASVKLPVAGCTAAPTAKPATMSWKTEPAMTIDTNATYTATIATNCGPITLKLDAAKAPHTVNSFVFLAGQHYFDHVICHRLTNETGLYVLQCGDPTGTGTGGPGYTFKDENLTGLGAAGSSGSVTYPAGTVAMANSGPNTNGSQFFLVYKDSQLPPSYTPFGTITGGLSELQAIGAAGAPNGDGKPYQAVTMNSVTTVKS